MAPTKSVIAILLNTAYLRYKSELMCIESPLIAGLQTKMDN